MDAGSANGAARELIALTEETPERAAEGIGRLLAEQDEPPAVEEYDGALLQLLNDRPSGDPILEHLELDLLGGLAARCVERLREPSPANRRDAWTLLDVLRRSVLLRRFADAGAVVNLTGATIFKRWTKNYKEQIYDSRILTTRHVVEALPSGTDLTLCSASGAGYYGSRGDDVLKEDERAGSDFLAGVSLDWEKEALAAAAKGVRVAVMRFGVILGKNGGFLLGPCHSVQPDVPPKNIRALFGANRTPQG